MTRAVNLPRMFPDFLWIVGALERHSVRHPRFGRFYSRRFYAAMVDEEYRLADLSPDSRVVVVGSGPFPVTAVELARRGCSVTAVDHDEAAIATARSVAEAAGMAIRWMLADGVQLSYHGYDAVIVALHVEPKVQVLRRILGTADPQTRIVYRNPRGSLCAAYSRVLPADIGPGIHGPAIPVSGKKELVALRTSAVQLAPATEPADVRTSLSLCDLAPNGVGTIAHAPDHPSLAALGLRPGRRCMVVTTQPWGGPVICSVGGREVALSRSVASGIEIAPLSGLS